MGKFLITAILGLAIVLLTYSKAPFEKRLSKNEGRLYSDTLIKIYITEHPSELAKITKSILETLHIGIRQNLSQDEQLTFRVQELRGGFVARFLADEGIVNQDSSQRFYKRPTILINPFLDTLMKKGPGNNNGSYFITVSAIVHELTHYYQATMQLSASPDSVDFSNVVSRRNYIKRPEEFEAHAAGYYYLLYYLKRSALEEIMRLNVNAKTRMKLIINVADKLLCQQEYIFPEVFR